MFSNLKDDMTAMKRPADFNIGRNERGAVLVLALLMLVILSIMGAFALTISSLEQRITSNSEIFQHNFYAVEAVTLEGAAALNQTDDAEFVDAAYPDNIDGLELDDPSINLRLSAQWHDANPGIVPEPTSLTAAAVDIRPPGYDSDGTVDGDRIWYARTDNGVCFGASLTDPDKEERCFDVYGMYDVKRGAGKAYTGRMLLTVGYKKIVYKNI